MKNILENIPVGLSVMDSKLNMVVDNPQFRALLDFPDTLFAGEVTTFESIIRFNAARGEYGPGDQDAIVKQIVDRARLGEAHRFQRQRAMAEPWKYAVHPCRTAVLSPPIPTSPN
ncbi:PAS-domain containing protein [Rhodoferax sp. AJA081-3]|nr:PAS-domain containing protein [Rhodoferax sp. AJA081-3]QTN30398.1 PAS-domain containing protein [Rhodoferax sp. AJA081-3]